MKFFINAQIEQTPKGKRSIRRNIYGNLNAFVSGKFWKTIGLEFNPTDEAKAAEWLAGKEV